MTPHGCITASPEIRAGVFSLPARPPNICLWPDAFLSILVYLMLSSQTATPSAASALYPAAMTERLGVPKRYFM